MTPEQRKKNIQDAEALLNAVATDETAPQQTASNNATVGAGTVGTVAPVTAAQAIGAPTVGPAPAGGPSLWETMQSVARKMKGQK